MSDLQQEQAVNGAANATLSNIQKKNVCMAAAEAWERVGRPFFDRNPESPELALSKGEAIGLWRHEEQVHILGKRHLTQAIQADFPLLMAHFQQMAGKTASASYWRGRRTDDDQRRALAVLDIEKAKAHKWIANPGGYIAAIARSKYKVPIECLSSKQVWTMVFDLRRNVAARKAKAVQPTTGTLF